MLKDQGDIPNEDSQDIELNPTNLFRANLNGAILTDANLSGAQNLTQARLGQACGKPAHLPEGLQLDKPCPTFRPASLDGLVPPPQAPLVPLPYALEDSQGAVAGVY